MWQEVAIVVIGIGTIAYLGWKVYRMCTEKKNPDSPCSGCSGCALKDQMQRKECPDTKANPA